MEILITGGLGFVGSNLAKALVKDRHNVTLLDDTSNNIVDDVKGCKLVIDSCANISRLTSKFDLIFHFGEFARVEQSFKSPLNVLMNNRNSFLEVLKFAQKNNSKLIYSASSTLFGDNGQNRYESPYAFSKYQNVELLKSYAQWNSVNHCIVYFYNVFGPGENDTDEMGTVVGKFVRLRREQKKLPIRLPGTQKRNFTHIADTISALKLVAEKGFGDGYGIGNKDAYSIVELARLIEPDSDKYEYLPALKANRNDTELVCDKTIELGWKPEHTLENYINSLDLN